MPKNNISLRSDAPPRVRLKFDKEELTSIKVDIRRPNISAPASSLPLLRNLDDPRLLKIHFTSDEGVRPIFERDDVRANSIYTPLEHYSRKTAGVDQKRSTSRSSSSSSGRSTEDVSKLIAKSGRSMSNLQQHGSRKYSKERHQKEYYSSRRRSKSNSRKEIYKTRKTPPPSSSRYDRSPLKESSCLTRERSRESPPRYRERDNRRKPSRSPPRKSTSERTRYPSNSPPKYRGPPERRRQTRSPPPSSSRNRARSRSRTPSYRSRRSRSRYSRSPRRHSDYRRSRSPTRKHSRYTPDRHSRRSPRDDRTYHGPPIHPPYFDGTEFWIDPTLQPRFIPRMIPPGPFPYVAPFRPAMPIMMPRSQFRPRIIYNNRPRPRLPAAPAIETASTTTTSAAVTSSTVCAATSLEENRIENTEVKTEASKNCESES